MQQTAPVALAPWQGELAAPRDGETIDQAVVRVRETISKLHADLHELRSAPLPLAEVWPKIAAEVERQAEAGRPGVLQCIEQGRDIEWPRAAVEVKTYRPDLHGAITVHLNDGFALQMWLNKPAILKRLRAELEDVADEANAIGTAERREREAELRAEILEVERGDVDLVEASAGAVAHRPAEQIDPRALLGVEGPAPREDW
jgi:hypothetical protein